METKIKIVVDAMGGDYAPEVPVQGAVEALQENTVKCTFLMILPTTRSSISLPEI